MKIEGGLDHGQTVWFISDMSVIRGKITAMKGESDGESPHRIEYEVEISAPPYAARVWYPDFTLFKSKEELVEAILKQ